MSSSGIHEENYVTEREHATGHRWDVKEKMLVNDDEKTLPATQSDGGIFTTSEDLHKWSDILLGKRPDILSPQIIKLMTAPNPNTFGIYGGYGYGLFIDGSMTQRIHHPGWISGFRSHFCLYPKEEIYISVFCNNTTTNPMQISSDLAEIIGIKIAEIS
jgi:CubicO group peptidase (beta-lactamase class C family)